MATKAERKAKKSRIKNFAKYLAEPLFHTANIDRSTEDVLLTSSAVIAAMMLRDGEAEDEVKAAAALVNEVCRSNEYDQLYTPHELSKFRDPLEKRKLKSILDTIDPMKTLELPISEFDGENDEL